MPKSGTETDVELTSSLFIYLRNVCVWLFRISKLFEIIVEFPESKPALSELKV